MGIRQIDLLQGTLDLLILKSLSTGANHGYGIATCFAHNSEVLVKQGDVVQRGSLVSRVGNTGQSTGPHLHYEVRFNGVAKDPSLFILN